MDGRTKLSGSLRCILGTVKKSGPPVEFYEFTGKFFRLDGNYSYHLKKKLENSVGKKFYVQILNDDVIVDLIDV